jgi:hypothetical protein
MGYSQPHPDYRSTTYWYKEGKPPLVLLSFDRDWNWLMSVVDKIESLGYEFFIVESRCRIAHNTDKSIETIIYFENMGKKIDACYDSVVQFIEWYNETKQK